MQPSDCHPRPARRRPGLTITLAALGLAALSAPNARAGFSLTSGSSTTTYSVRPLTLELGQSPVGTPVLSEGVLDAIPGYFSDSPFIFGDLKAQTLGSALGSTQTFKADPSQIGNILAPFGTGSTSLSAFSSGTISSGLTSKAGVNWASTFVTSGAQPGIASVSVTTASATFKNSGSSVTGYLGTSMSLAGTLDMLDGVSFVAASLATTITTSIGSNTTVVTLAPIVFAYGLYAVGEDSFLGQTPVALASTYKKVNIDQNNLAKYSFTGSARGDSVTFGNGDSFTVTSTLTMIADPATLGVSDLTDPDALPFLPDFGTFATTSMDLGSSLPTPIGAPVPEPATLAAALLGLAGGLLAYRKSRRA